MGLFFNFHDDRLPPGSFQTPVQPPAQGPGAFPLVTVCINSEWIPFILGALSQLTMNTTWSGSDAEIEAARTAANDLILLFQMALPGCQTQNPGFSGAGDEFMLRQDPDNPCLLQTSVDGMTWCTWADLSKCTGQPQQPGAGSPNPPAGGGCTSYLGEVAFGTRWMLPNNVSTGDTITVEHAQGTWASALDLYLARCPDGNLFFEVGCVDGTGHTEPGDPAPAINHDSLIAFDGTNYYDCGPASDNMPVVITIPSGIDKANLFFFANTPDTTGFGSVTFDVKYCNNAPANWMVTLDFGSGKFGFTPGYADGVTDDAYGDWQPTHGWSWQEGVNSGGVGKRASIIHRNQVFHGTRIIMTFDYTKGAIIDAGSAGTFIDNAGTNIVNTTQGAQSNGTNLQLDTGPISVDFTILNVGLFVDEQVGSVSGFTGACLIKSLQIFGSGPNPFAF